MFRERTHIMNTDVQTVIEGEVHRLGATRRRGGVWRQSVLATARWDDWALRDDDLRHPVDAPRHAGDNNVVPSQPKIRPVLVIRRCRRAGWTLAAIATEVGLPEAVVQAVLDSPLTRALTLLEEAENDGTS